MLSLTEKLNLRMGGQDPYALTDEEARVFGALYQNEADEASMDSAAGKMAAHAGRKAGTPEYTALKNKFLKNMQRKAKSKDKKEDLTIDDLIAQATEKGMLADKASLEALVTLHGKDVLQEVAKAIKDGEVPAALKKQWKKKDKDKGKDNGDDDDDENGNGKNGKDKDKKNKKNGKKEATAEELIRAVQEGKKTAEEVVEGYYNNDFSFLGDEDSTEGDEDTETEPVEGDEDTPNEDNPPSEGDSYPGFLPLNLEPEGATEEE